MKKYFRIINWSVIIGIVFLFSLNVIYAAPTPPPETRGFFGTKSDFDFTPIPSPDLNFDFGIKFTQNFDCPPEILGEGANKRTVKIICIPWLGEYIAGIYRYGISLAAILAVVMIMVGGFLWLSSGGSSDKIKTAQSYIWGAFYGLVLALLSFMILNSINPRLVSLDPLRVETYGTPPASNEQKSTPGHPGVSCVTSSSSEACNALEEADNVSFTLFREGVSCSDIAICGSTASKTVNCCVVTEALLKDGKFCNGDDSKCASGVCNTYLKDMCQQPYGSGKVGCKRGVECISGVCNTNAFPNKCQ